MTPNRLWHHFGPFAFFLDCFKYQSIGSLYGDVGLWMVD
jgi:hypothetical protein